MKNKIPYIYKVNKNYLPISFKFIVIKEIKELKEAIKTFPSDRHQTDFFRLDKFYKRSNTVLPQNFFK